MMNKYKMMIEKLKNGEIESIEITKEEFWEFREVLVNDEKFKHFRGEAKQGEGSSIRIRKNREHKPSSIH